jgi:hypothetical protein
MADPLGQTTDPQAAKTADVTIRESQVKEELSGWYSRLCAREAEEAQKQLEINSMGGANGEIPLINRYQGGQALDRLQAWQKRGEAARRGVLLMDNFGQRDPAYICNPQIKGLQQRCTALGLIEFEEPVRQLGPRF